MRNVILFAILMLVLASLAPRFMERVTSGAGVTAAATSAPSQVSSSPSTVIVSRGPGGHFQVEATVDGRRMNFLVDTGATWITITETHAAQLGIHPAQRDYTARTRTANGIARAAPVRLSMVEVGGLVVRDVDAIVMPDSSLGQNLLGMSFLSKLRRWEYSGGRLVMEQ